MFVIYQVNKKKSTNNGLHGLHDDRPACTCGWNVGRWILIQYVRIDWLLAHCVLSNGWLTWLDNHKVYTR